MSFQKEVLLRRISRWSRLTEAGENPAVGITGARYSVNMISSLFYQGKLHLRLVGDGKHTVQSLSPVLTR